jgi:hypothetical protein
MHVMEQLKRIDLAKLLSRWGGPASLLLGALFLLLGLALVLKHENSNDGSPFGWLFIVLGICGLLATLGFESGLYE